MGRQLSECKCVPHTQTPYVHTPVVINTLLPCFGHPALMRAGREQFVGRPDLKEIATPVTFFISYLNNL